MDCTLESEWLVVEALTVFAAAEPACHCNSQVEMLPRAERQEFKLLYCPHTLIHFIA